MSPLGCLQNREMQARGSLVVWLRFGRGRDAYDAC